MKKLSQLMQQRLGHHALSRSAFAAQVLHEANQILVDLLEGSDGFVSAFRYENQILFISTKSAVWSQEVWGVQTHILDLLNSKFNNRLKKIVIKHLTTT